MEFTELRDVMAEIFEVDPDQITEASTPDDVEGWDSMRLLDLLLTLEKQHGIIISPDRIHEMVSVGAILRLVSDASSKAAVLTS